MARVGLYEYQHQQLVIKWTQQPQIRKKYPDLKLLYHVANERKCTPKQGAFLKRMGLRKGVPDLHLPVAKGEYHSLYIEMKDETGATSPDQEWWIREMMQKGNFCEVCHGWESAVRVLEWYLNL